MPLNYLREQTQLTYGQDRYNVAKNQAQGRLHARSYLGIVWGYLILFTTHNSSIKLEPWKNQGCSILRAMFYETNLPTTNILNWKCSWYNDYPLMKWTRWHEFKSSMKLIAFHKALGKGMNPLILPSTMGK